MLGIGAAMELMVVWFRGDFVGIGWCGGVRLVYQWDRGLLGLMLLWDRFLLGLCSGVTGIGWCGGIRWLLGLAHRWDGVVFYVLGSMSLMHVAGEFYNSANLFKGFFNIFGEIGGLFSCVCAPLVGCDRLVDV